MPKSSTVIITVVALVYAVLLYLCLLRGILTEDQTIGGIILAFPVALIFYILTRLDILHSRGNSNQNLVKHYYDLRDKGFSILKNASIEHVNLFEPEPGYIFPRTFSSRASFLETGGFRDRGRLENTD